MESVYGGRVCALSRLYRQYHLDRQIGVQHPATMGLKGWLSGILQAIVVIPFLGIAVLAAGLSAAPALYLFHIVSPHLADLSPVLFYCASGVLLITCYMVYGFALILVAPTLNFILCARLKPYRGSAVGLGCLRWYIHAALTLVVRLSFLEFITPTPFSLLFYRLMGMKIGRNVTINSTAIADPSLIELGDKVTIGGSASIMAHYAQGGFIVISPTKIGKGATIGLRAIVMGGVEIGEKAKVLAGSFVIPKTVIPAGETWGGIPARPFDMSKFREEMEC